jgi:hypothetical protein
MEKLLDHLSWYTPFSPFLNKKKPTI